MRRISIKSLARVEGHGGITVTIDGKKVKDVRINIYEGPRLIEELVVGKSPEDVLNIVPRICGICNLSHRYAALRGLEKALDMKLPLRTKLTRDLMLLGEIIQSHSLHIFFLSLPDFLGYSSAMDMVDNFGEEVKRGIALKSFGYRIMELISARMIHGENPILGGFGAHPSKSALIEIKDRANNLMSDAEKTVELMASFDYPSYAECETIFMALNPLDGKYGFVGDSILISTGEERNVEEYKKVIQERVVPYSFAKRSRYNGEPFTVGALARMNLFGERLTGKAGKCFKKLYSTRWLKNPFFNNLAQAIEVLYSLETISRLVDSIMKLREPMIEKPSNTLSSGIGTGAIEAPRGILYHHYSIKDGLIADCDIATPTAQNLDDIERYLRIAVNNLLSAGIENNLELKLEMLVRAYDPCISCSAHSIKIEGIHNLFNLHTDEH
ncbi:Ni/Fe hydrogenase subunit alpha [candidate division WOR-3 bacterium]|nr:Ni/Fe hydrogenase subunit alpha [candidate division WOR-3 bacterium]